MLSEFCCSAVGTSQREGKGSTGGSDCSLNPSPSYASSLNAGMNISFSNGTTRKHHCGNTFQFWHATHKTLDLLLKVRGSVFLSISERGKLSSPASLNFFSHHFCLNISAETHSKSDLSSEVCTVMHGAKPALTPEDAERRFSSAFPCQEH